VLLHRCSTKGGENIYRMILDVPTGDESVTLDPWKAVLTTPELRKEWDPAVEDAHLVEVFDHVSRICKTNYTLGWPAKYVRAIFGFSFFSHVIFVARETRLLSHALFMTLLP